MTEKISVDLGNVQKTLFLPLWGRAVELKKEQPMLVDPTALEIVEKVDIDFASLSGSMSELSQIAWIIRSNCVDEIIRDFLAKFPNGTIVNIGCGLDTTFERVDNGKLTWYDLDLPDVIELRKKFISESPRREFVSCSFLEEGWLHEIRVSECVLFIAAGVFYYFQENEIRTFFNRVADLFPGCQLFFDVSSPRGVRTANKMVIQRSGLDEKSFLTWGLDKPETISAWDQRFHILGITWYFQEKARHLKLRTRLVGWLSDLLKIQYMIHMEMKPGAR